MLSYCMTVTLSIWIIIHGGNYLEGNFCLLVLLQHISLFWNICFSILGLGFLFVFDIIVSLQTSWKFRRKLTLIWTARFIGYSEHRIGFLSSSFFYNSSCTYEFLIVCKCDLFSFSPGLNGNNAPAYVTTFIPFSLLCINHFCLIPLFPPEIIEE